MDHCEAAPITPLKLAEESGERVRSPTIINDDVVPVCIALVENACDSPLQQQFAIPGSSYNRHSGSRPACRVCAQMDIPFTFTSSRPVPNTAGTAWTQIWLICCENTATILATV